MNSHLVSLKSLFKIHIVYQDEKFCIPSLRTPQLGVKGLHQRTLSQQNQSTHHSCRNVGTLSTVLENLMLQYIVAKPHGTHIYRVLRRIEISLFDIFKSVMFFSTLRVDIMQLFFQNLGMFYYTCTPLCIID